MDKSKNKISKQTISDYCDIDYLEYANYVIEHRAIPSVIDGLKPSQRKVIFTANKIWKNYKEKPLKVYQFGGKVASMAGYHHGDCIKGNTKIKLANGTYITIEEWFEKYPDQMLYVYAVDEETNQLVIAEAHSPRIGNITNIMYEIEMEDGTLIECTSNHPFKISNGSWIQACELTDDMEIISFANTIREAKI